MNARLSERLVEWRECLLEQAWTVDYSLQRILLEIWHGAVLFDLPEKRSMVSQ